jgi:phospholipid/cholesterol/gamma-HCH transport system ATP-binding protein
LTATTPADNSATTELRGVTMKFGSRTVLDDISLLARPGRRLGLIGPAAGGKSIIAKLWCGLETATSGEVLTLGQRLATLAEGPASKLRARIGMLFQNYALFDFLTVIGNVSFPLQRQGGMSQSEIDDRSAARLRAVGLAGSEHKFPSQLSGGMKKRAGIARATVSAPELMIYDEPTAGLDPVTTQKVYDLLSADHQLSGGTVIAISSDVLALARFVDDIAFLHNGRIRYLGPATDISNVDDDAVRQFVRGELNGPLSDTKAVSLPAPKSKGGAK